MADPDAFALQDICGFSDPEGNPALEFQGMLVVIICEVPCSNAVGLVELQGMLIMCGAIDPEAETFSPFQGFWGAATGILLLPV
jgi:hypothetical protein